jgi:hypothetical protein
VVALIDQRMRGRSRSIDVPFGKYAQVYTFREGLIVHWKGYWNRSEALKAVGWRGGISSVTASRSSSAT